MSKHTPGPWKAVASGIQAPTCLVVGDDTIKPDDARLIAAAPDLLAACKQMLAPPKKREDLLSDASAKRFAKIYKEMRAAIAKAEGTP